MAMKCCTGHITAITTYFASMLEATASSSMTCPHFNPSICKCDVIRHGFAWLASAAEHHRKK